MLRQRYWADLCCSWDRSHETSRHDIALATSHVPVSNEQKIRGLYLLSICSTGLRGFYANLVERLSMLLVAIVTCYFVPH